MNSRIRSGRRRPTVPIALALAALGGCATTRSTEPAPSGATEAGAPDLLVVSSIAPAIDAERDRPARRPDRPPADRSLAPVGSSTDRPTAPRQTDPPGQPPSNPMAGLMGPTPPISPTAAATPPSIPESSPARPIDLPSALRLADGQNPIIGEARVLILEALAQRLAARALLLPYLNAGTNYHDHTGPLQRSSGTILPLTEQSLYVGGGARTVAAESVAIPAVNIFSPLTEAIYEPLAAQQRLIGARFNASDTANKVLLEVAGLYIDLIGAETNLQARRVTAIEADRVAASVIAFAREGQGRQADANRADADRRLFQADIQRAEERVAVASAMLAQRLNLDPSSRLQPMAGPLEPITLIDPATPADDLVRSAVARRPDLAAREALVGQAQTQVRKEKARPLLPTLWLGFSGGAFGGGSDLVPGTLGAFAGRTDFDVRAYWTVLNLGAGNASLIKQRKAQAGQAIAERSRVLNEVRAEVTSARGEALAFRDQVAVAERGLRVASDAYREDQARLRESLALPIEALDSLRLLSDARVVLIEAITRSNRAQFALFVSLGAPPPIGPMAAPVSADAVH